MDYTKTKVAFFIERKSRKAMNGQKLPREVTAVFVESGNYRMKECYAHVGQHGVCAVDWVDENCRPATFAEYKPLMDEMQGMVGYNLEVVDGEWWLTTAMGVVRKVDEYRSGKAA